MFTASPARIASACGARSASEGRHLRLEQHGGVKSVAARVLRAQVRACVRTVCACCERTAPLSTREPAWRTARRGADVLDAADTSRCGRIQRPCSQASGRFLQLCNLGLPAAAVCEALGGVLPRKRRFYAGASALHARGTRRRLPPPHVRCPAPSAGRTTQV